MTEAGFEVPDPTEEPRLRDDLKYWYGLTDSDVAAVDGYTGSNPTISFEDVTTDEENMEAISPDPARQQAYLGALRGADSDRVNRDVVNPITGEGYGVVGLVGGCAGEARRTVYDGAEGYLTVAATYDWLRLQTREIRGEAEPDARDAAEAWVACMAAQGYPPSHRFWGDLMRESQSGEDEGVLGLIPSSGPSWSELPDPRPSSEEIAMATADTRCKDESGWTRVIFETEYRLQSELAAAAAEFIARARAAEDAAIAQATEILNKG